MSLNPTTIDWVPSRHGRPFTWNPIVGCSMGCEYCYARRQAKRQRRNCESCYQFRPHIHEERLGDLTIRQAPKDIFVCSMGEIFDPALRREDTEDVLMRMRACCQHQYYVLTKRPERLDGFRSAMLGRVPAANWAVGVSADSSHLLSERAFDLLSQPLGRASAFVSLEPLLGSCANALGNYVCQAWIEGEPTMGRYLDWVIVGAQTGPQAVRPPRGWVDDIVDACARTTTPVWVKDNLQALYPNAGWPKQTPWSEGNR